MPTLRQSPPGRGTGPPAPGRVALVAALLSCVVATAAATPVTPPGGEEPFGGLLGDGGFGGAAGSPAAGICATCPGYPPAPDAHPGPVFPLSEALRVISGGTRGHGTGDPLTAPLPVRP